MDVLALGIQPKVVQETLGHSRMAVTMDLYTHALRTFKTKPRRRWTACSQSSKHPFFRRVVVTVVVKPTEAPRRGLLIVVSRFREVVELRGFEPLTSTLPVLRSPD